jgi:hypothetical protein
LAEKSSIVTAPANQSIGKENSELSVFRIRGDLAAHCSRDGKYFLQYTKYKNLKELKILSKCLQNTVPTKDTTYSLCIFPCIVGIIVISLPFII